MRPQPTRPVLVIHDMWLHAGLLDPWIHLLGDHGRVASAPGWPGEHPAVSDTHVELDPGKRRPVVGLIDLVDHYSAVARSCPQAPVVVGHGLGALVAEVLLARGHAWAAAAVEPAVLRGVMPLSWRQLVAGSLLVRAGAVRSQWTSLTRQQFQLVFGATDAGPAAEVHRRWATPSPAGPLLDAATGDDRLRSELDRASVPRRRHLVITCDPDRLTPPGLIRTNLVASGSRPLVRRITGRSASLFLDQGWVDVAQAVVSWLNDIDAPSKSEPQEPAPQGALTDRQLFVH